MGIKKWNAQKDLSVKKTYLTLYLKKQDKHALKFKNYKSKLQ